MAETQYTYSIANDMPAGAVNTTKLAVEIQASGIVTALERIDTSGDVLKVIFKAALSAGDKTLLDNDATGPSGGLLAAHDNTPGEAEASFVKLCPDCTNVVEIEEVSPSPLNYRNKPMPAMLVIESPATEGFVEMYSGYDYHLLSIEYFGGTGSGAVLGDTISAWVDYQRDLNDFLGPYGLLQEDETTADATIAVAAQAFGTGLLQVGYYVHFASAENPEYEIIALDRVANTITLDRNLENARSAGDHIFRSITMGRDIWVTPSSVSHEYGASKIGSSRIPAGWKFRIGYDAVDTDGRTIIVTAEGGILES